MATKMRITDIGGLLGIAAFVLAVRTMPPHPWTAFGDLFYWVILGFVAAFSLTRFSVFREPLAIRVFTCVVTAMAVSALCLLWNSSPILSFGHALIGLIQLVVLPLGWIPLLRYRVAMNEPKDWSDPTGQRYRESEVRALVEREPSRAMTFTKTIGGVPRSYAEVLKVRRDYES